jgi:very-short-patch-repair endonuclease
MTTDRDKLAFARKMRRDPTLNERALWRLLRDRRLEGVKFRRQVPIGRYIVDFLRLRHRLIVEADGPTHEDSLHDLERDAWLQAQGFRLMRFRNAEIEMWPDRVLDAIRAAIVAPRAEDF